MFDRLNVDVFVILGTPVPLVNARILLQLHRLCRVRVYEHVCVSVNYRIIIHEQRLSREVAVRESIIIAFTWTT
jgi:hypothetical protein